MSISIRIRIYYYYYYFFIIINIVVVFSQEKNARLASKRENENGIEFSSESIHELE